MKKWIMPGSRLNEKKKPLSGFMGSNIDGWTIKSTNHFLFLGGLIKNIFMNRIVCLISCLACMPAVLLFAQKPVLPDFHADPSAHVWDGQVWIYPSHDRAGSSDWDMTDWHCFSSNNLSEWTDHGVIFRLADLSWADRWAWAPDCARRNGTYYFYFPADDQIGVAIGDRPDGPFSDALGKPLIERNEGDTRVMDPMIFIDTDGTPYLYFGQNELRVVILNEDMISRKSEIMKIDAKNFHEGVWMHRYKENYYLTYPSYKGEFVANLLEYSIGKTPLGPFEYKGVFFDNRSRNVHHSIIEIEGQWYLFYHVQGPSPYERRVCIEYLEHDANGLIRPLNMTREGVRPIVFEK